ncbi:MAG: hypothetical protein IPH79_11850 [Sphingomonadales bacterium]|nr:hypothetical protein [Sphingomonadales bacterium]
MRRGVIIIALGLSSCGGPPLSDNQRAEVENIAEDFADGATSDVASRVDNSELENKIGELESRIEKMDGEIGRLRDQNVEDANAAAELERRINELRNR